MAKAPDAGLRTAVFFAMKEIEAHPSVASVGDPTFGPAMASVVVTIDVGLGNRLRAQAGSQNGVGALEDVRFDFSSAYPAKPPEFSLRSGFSRDHPHIQPWLVGDRVVPCVVDGDVGEFIAANGLYGLVGQIRLWLDNAAHKTLMNPGQGWEPTRRDGYPDFLIANPDKLRGIVDRKGGWKCFRVNYGFAVAEDFTPFFFGELGEPTNINSDIREGRGRKDSRLGQGETIAIVTWGDKNAICGEYLPDDFRTVEKLVGRMDAYGTRRQVETPLGLLRQRAQQQPGNAVFPLIVVNLVRRPYQLIGTSSDIEICGYVVPLRTGTGALVNMNDEVRPLALRHAMEPALLRELSGDPVLPPWVLLGCGSLGSKVAMHATRGGNAPKIVADKAMLGPHNVARHALYPLGSALQMGWLGGKADALASALEGMGSSVRALGDDHVELAQQVLAIKGKSRPKWIVNATASMVVRESLSQPEMDGLPRMVGMGLYDAGQLGYVAIEGESRNPNAVELEASLYQTAAATPALAKHLFQPAGGAERVRVGQGCGSLTIRMSDATLSVMSAPMTEIFAGLGDVERGGLHLLRRDGIGLAHDHIVIPPFRRISVEGMEGWRMSVADDVFRRITKEAAEHPTTETGGVLLGWSSMIARQIVITDLLPAPNDSARSRTKFELGVDGVAAQLAEIHERSAGQVRCVGTWHSHLGSAAPSMTDRISAAIVSAGYMHPMAFLIIGSDGLRAVSMPARLVEAADSGTRKSA